MKKKISEVKIGDRVMGTDGKWHKVIGKTEPKLCRSMFEIEFSNGKVKCADTHQWNIYVEDKMYTIDALGIYRGIDFYAGKHIGTIDGPTVIGIKQIDPMVVQCITTDAKDNQFLIYTEET